MSVRSDVFKDLTELLDFFSQVYWPKTRIEFVVGSYRNSTDVQQRSVTALYCIPQQCRGDFGHCATFCSAVKCQQQALRNDVQWIFDTANRLSSLVKLGGFFALCEQMPVSLVASANCLFIVITQLKALHSR